MGEKEAASQALEGTFDTNALRAMMNGGTNDDIIAALATQLENGKKVDAQKAWKNADPKTAIKPSRTIKLKLSVSKQVVGTWQRNFLFDMNPENETACASAQAS